MFVSICAYCGKVRQLGRGVKAGGHTYCCQAHAILNQMRQEPSGSPAGRIEHRKRHGRGDYYPPDYLWGGYEGAK